jgi:FlaA1/EpsC-like NDP-sugar epimerase
LNTIFHLPKKVKIFISIIIDLIILNTSIVLSYFLTVNNLSFPSYLLLQVFIPPLIILIMFFLKFYSTFTRFVGIINFKNIFILNLLLIIFYYFLNLFFLTSNFNFFIFHVFLFFSIILISRFSIKILYIYSKIKLKNKQKIFIYGAGDAGYSFLTSLDFNKFKVIGFIDDDKYKKNKLIGKYNIFDFDDIVNDKFIFQADLIALCIPSSSRKQRNEIIKKISFYNIKISTIPSLEDIINNSPINLNFKNFALEDFLNRSMFYDTQDLSYFKNKVILITGAGGSIGREISKQIKVLDIKKIVLIDNNEYNLYITHKEILNSNLNQLNDNIIPIIGNIQDIDFLENIFNNHKFDVVIHSAAYKHVDLVEKNINEAVKNNIFGSKNLIDLSIKHQIKKFKLISTDKAVNPYNFMGATKRIIELYIKYLTINHLDKKTVFSIVRFGNVFGSSGSVVELFHSQLLSGGPLTVTSMNTSRYFISVTEAVNLVIHSLNISERGKIYVLDMGEPFNIFELAKSIIKLSGNKIKDNKNDNDNSIAIKIIGLKKGEKENEELSYSGKLIDTKIKKIKITDEKNDSTKDVISLISSLNYIENDIEIRKKVINFCNNA